MEKDVREISELWKKTRKKTMARNKNKAKRRFLNNQMKKQSKVEIEEKSLRENISHTSEFK